MNKPRLWTKPFPWKAVLCASVILLCFPAPDAHAQNLDNVSSQNLVNQMKAKLGDGDLYGAVPLLLEFKKRAKDGEFKSSRLDKIDYFIALGYMKGFTEKRDKNLLKKAAERFEHYIKEYPSGSDIHYVLLNKVDCHRGTGDFKGAIKNGITREELKAILLQISVYCGVPTGVECFRIAQKVFAELDAVK